MNTNLVLSISSAATLLLALAAFWAIWQNRDARIRSRKERVLKELIDWLMSIRTVDVSIHIPITDKEMTGIEKKRLELNKLHRYFLPTLTCEYIRAMVRRTFKSELQSDFDNTIINLNAFIYIRSVCAGVKDVKDAFGGASIGMVEEVENQLIEGKKTKEQLLAEYDTRLIIGITNLLVKVGKIMAKL